MTIFSRLSGLLPKKLRKAPPPEAASDGETAEASAPQPSLFPSLVQWLLVMAGMSVLAIAIGAFVGLSMMSTARTDARDLAAAELRMSPDANLIALPPIITNLADPANAWVRLQTAIVLDKRSEIKPEVMAAEIADDLLGFMKTVTLAQIGGASGLQHLREDLTERAVIRSHGHVRELIIQTLVVQ